MTEHDLRQRILDAQPPIPAREPPNPCDRLDAQLNPREYGEKAPDPPAHKYRGPWAVYQAFDPARDSVEDLRDAALAARMTFTFRTERDALIEMGREALDLTRTFKAEHDGFSEWEVGRDIDSSRRHREPFEARVARVRAARLADGIPPAEPKPPSIVNDIGLWAMRRAYDPELDAPEDFDLAAALLEDVSFCTTGDPLATRAVNSACLALEAAADLRAGNDPITEEGLRDRWYFGVDPKTRRRRRQRSDDARAYSEAVGVAQDLIAFHRPPGFVIEPDDELASRQALHTRRRARAGEVSSEFREKPPAHVYRGPWAVHTVARAEGHPAGDVEIAVAALTGLECFGEKWREDALALARRVLNQVAKNRAAGSSLVPFEVALEAVLGRWPDALAWVRKGKDPGDWGKGPGVIFAHTPKRRRAS